MDPAVRETMAIQEIVELHRCFEQIFAGDAAALSRVDSALAPSFAMVVPSGEVLSRDQVMGGLEGSLGSRAVAIRILNPTVRWITVSSMLASYEEWQDGPTGTTARQASVLFEVDPEGHAGLRWQWVHETWMAP